MKKYIETTKEQDKDGASPLVSLIEVINIIKRYSANNDDLENVWKTCEDLIKLMDGLGQIEKEVQILRLRSFGNLQQDKNPDTYNYQPEGRTLRAKIRMESPTKYSTSGEDTGYKLPFNNLNDVSRGN